ncbi:aldo/keto reductase [Streptomyces sp. MP131-18]|uniref:aldo/keto reductase n=1 Tax=Streptomyces sp. MP131-18 TaxID=1857892 RepID=UPI00097C19D8|nr:aldo/keto reductase [Streptomyces sp. MP131-18]ONK15362.1 General stress protein 69 [Streptomyces sp. MP131-18]
MHTVALGPTGLEVSAIGLGCMSMSEFFGPADRQEALATLRLAVDQGVTFLDTSDMYGVGSANELLLGDFLRTSAARADVVVATKFGAVRDPHDGRLLGLRADPAYVAAACDASLRRLGTDHIDLYYLHHPDPKVPVEDTVGAMAALVAAGKVRHLGLSNVTAAQLRAGHLVHPVAAVQSEWSLFGRDAERDLVPACASLGIGFVPYSPLGRGFLTGQYSSAAHLTEDDFRRTIPRFNGENAAHNARLLAPLLRIAQARSATPAQIALAWLLTRPAHHGGLPVVPIPGTKRRARLLENAGAAHISLTAAETAALDPLAERVRGAGSPELTPEQLRMLHPDRA